MVSYPVSDSQYRKVKPYQKVSLFYDQMMDHVDYGHWSRYIQLLIRKFGLPHRRILEAGCGTGSFAGTFPFPLIGMDLSTEMIRIARKRYPDAMLLVDKMPELGSLKTESCDGVLILYDTINYLTDPEDWSLLFRRLLDILTPKGWVIFDIVTRYCCTTYFMLDRIEEELNGIHYERIIEFDEKSAVQHNYFRISSGEGHFYEHHRQFIPLDEWIDSQLEKTGWKTWNKFHEFTTREAKRKSLRIHYLLRKG